jgi:hypothetical protein
MDAAGSHLASGVVMVPRAASEARLLKGIKQVPFTGGKMRRETGKCKSLNVSRKMAASKEMAGLDVFLYSAN